MFTKTPSLPLAYKIKRKQSVEMLTQGGGQALGVCAECMGLRAAGGKLPLTHGMAVAYTLAPYACLATSGAWGRGTHVKEVAWDRPQAASGAQRWVS